METVRFGKYGRSDSPYRHMVLLYLVADKGLSVQLLRTWNRNRNRQFYRVEVGRKLPDGSCREIHFDTNSRREALDFLRGVRPLIAGPAVINDLYASEEC